MLIFQPEIKERTNVPDNQGTATVLLRFVSLRSASTKIGDVKMDRHDRELLDKQMRRLSAPRNDGVIVVMLAAMFLVGVVIGGVVFPHQSEPTQIASTQIASIE
jgi:hypothetical protein